MHLPDYILGKGTVETLQQRIKSAVLTIGNDKFTRAHLARNSCFNFLAAATLSNIVNHELQVKDTRDLFLNVSPQALALPGLGAISLATLGCAFEEKLGKTLEDYINHHRADETPIVTFHTMKHNSADAKADAKMRKQQKARKHGRNAQAHEHRVTRHLTRHAGSKVATTTNS